MSARDGKHPVYLSGVLDLHGTGTATLASARRWAVDVLPELGAEHRDDVLLVVTELLANAHEHGHGPGQLRLAHACTPCRVRIEVEDHSLVRPVVRRPRAAQSPRGRGMLLVDQLAESWGVREDPTTGTKTVWAEVRPTSATQIPA